MANNETSSPNIDPWDEKTIIQAPIESPERAIEGIRNLLDDQSTGIITAAETFDRIFNLCWEHAMKNAEVPEREK